MDRAALEAAGIVIPPLDQAAMDAMDRTAEDRSAPRLTPSQKQVIYPLYSELKLTQIETGRYGDVFKCRHKYLKEIVAMKIINIPENEKKNGVPGSIIRQVSILKELDHPHIIKLLSVSGTEDDVYLAFEHIELNFHRYLNNPMIISSSRERRSIQRQILSAVDYLHSHKILHRDLRPHNILVNIQPNYKHDEVKLTGFGAARTFELPLSSYSGNLGNPCYRAPELLFGSTKYSTAVDIWSVGCIFAEMANQKPLFKGQDETKILVQIFCLLGTPTEETWPGLSKVCNYMGVLDPPIQATSLAEKFPELERNGVDLLSKMLCLCPEQRISAEEALEHEYFR